MGYAIRGKLLCLLLLPSACATPPKQTGLELDPLQLQAAADAAFEYGYPLTELMRVCETLPQVNRLYSKSTLATPADRKVVMPNNDTLYSAACLYLGSGWVQLTLPPAGGRYMSAEIFDAYTNNVTLASGRDRASEQRTIVLRYPGARGAELPAGVPVFDVPTPYAYALIRTLVNGPSDLAAARAAQSGIALRASTSDTPARPEPLKTSTRARKFYGELMQRLAQNPPHEAERELVESFAKVGVRASLAPDLTRITQEQSTAWESAFTRGFSKLQEAAARMNEIRGTWAFPHPQIATPGSDYTMRAVTARYGLFPLPPSESIYPFTIANGNTPHVLTLPPGWQPVDAGGFWSLSMYADGYLVDNPIHRYSIGDRTSGLKKEADGAIRIDVQCTNPGAAHEANWLPAPCGPYTLTMRLYLPNASARDGKFMLPPLQ